MRLLRLVAVLLAACDYAPTPPAPLPFADRPIDEAGLVRAFPADRVDDREGWATDLRAVFDAHALAATNGNACAVVAIVEQESGYAPDPAVPGIGGMVDGWIAEKQSALGALPGKAFERGLRALLDERGTGERRTFYERLHAAKTERDLDLTFRAFVEHQRRKLPAPLRAAESAAQWVGLDLDGLNPVTTAGCMQVKVDHAEAHARDERQDPAGVRDALYTRSGCLHYGTERLLAWKASYDEPIYRFADYNAGVYASRNAAFQEQLSALAGTPLALDGDLLRYTDAGAPASSPSATLTAARAVVARYGLELSDGRVERDLAREKTAGFEETEVYIRVREAFAEKSGAAPAYARLPDVTLDSVKLSGNKTTKWFANSVVKRYRACLARLGAPASRASAR